MKNFQTQKALKGKKINAIFAISTALIVNVDALSLIKYAQFVEAELD